MTISSRAGSPWARKHRSVLRIVAKESVTRTTDSSGTGEAATLVMPQQRGVGGDETWGRSRRLPERATLCECYAQIDATYAWWRWQRTGEGDENVRWPREDQSGPEVIRARLQGRY